MSGAVRAGSRDQGRLTSVVAGIAADAEVRYSFKDFPHSSHRVLADLVGGEPARVLDVGTASGYLGRALTALGHTVVGVENSDEAAALARASYAALHVVDAQALPDLPEAPFDVAVLGDVLEHLADPEAALARVVAQLRPGGRVLVSVPNIAFVQVRLALAAGRFAYADRGILDATHLRFFTRRTLVELLRRQGLDARRVLGVPPPLPLVLPATARWPGRALLEVSAVAARLWPTMMAYQLVAEGVL